MDRIANQLTIESPWSIESMWLLMDESIEKKGRLSLSQQSWVRQGLVQPNLTSF